MTKSTPKNSKTDFFTPVRRWLLASTAVNASFVIFVAVATQGSLSPYTYPHGVLVLISLAAFFAQRTPKAILYIALCLSILGALVAIFLTLSFANYYQQYLESH